MLVSMCIFNSDDDCYANVMLRLQDVPTFLNNPSEDIPTMHWESDNPEALFFVSRFRVVMSLS